MRGNDGVAGADPLAARLFESVYTEAGGDPLWREPYPFKRLSAPGEVFVRNYASWMVLNSRRIPGTDEIRTIVRRVNSTVPAGVQQPDGGQHV